MLKVAGGNIYHQLCSESNNKSTNNYPVVSPPGSSDFDISSLISYSVYCDHSVWVTKEGRARAIGDNSGGRIHGSLPKEKIIRSAEFDIIDKQKNKYDIISAVCGLYYSLYLIHPRNESCEAKLAYVYYNKNDGFPIFLDMGNKCPIALYGGYKNSASINKDGSICIINKSVYERPANSPHIASLPNNEKSINIACCDRFIIALSSTCKVYLSSISINGDTMSPFEEISSLKEIRIVQISGTFDFCLAVSDNKRVFRYETRQDGFNSFTEIKELEDKKICAAYGGYNHSLFQTNDGKILACGNNDFGQLLSKTGPSAEDTTSAIETSINGGATFCIAGYQLSAVYIITDPPSNSPNKEVTHIKNLPTNLDHLNLNGKFDNGDKNHSKCCLIL